VLGDWVKRNAIDTVVFNEEYDWGLIDAARGAGAKVATYLDFHRHDWKAKLPAYDLVLCSTRRTWELVRDLPNAAFVGWAVDTTTFAPHPRDEARHTFFHNAGWLGINYRKMTPAVILAFDALSEALPRATLLIHSQLGVAALPPECQRLVRDNPRIIWQAATVPAPGFYHRGAILVFPSKLEGLGLPLPEGLSCGLPAIATDAPPMTEFVTSGENGLLVRVAAARTREDGIAFPETIVDLNDLAAKMLELGADLPRAHEMGLRARERALVQFDRATFNARVRDAFERMWEERAIDTGARAAASRPPAVPDLQRAS
jgi:glycosyltransferase involved in cell wall biosynthesis